MKRYMALAVALFIGAQSVGVRAHAGQIAVIENPNPAHYQLNEGEQLLMVVPSPEADPVAPARFTPPPAPKAKAPAPVSEVANEVSRRDRNVKKEPVAQDERIPWWKGGLWRNGDNGEEDPEPAPSSDTPPPNRTRRFGFGSNNDTRDSADRDNRDDDPVAARRNRDTRDAARRDSRDREEADLWDDATGGYSDGYNDNAAFGGQRDYDPYARPYPQSSYPMSGSYVATGVADPYAAPQQGGFDPYAQQQPYADPYAQQPYAQQPYAQPQQGYVSEPFTDPNAPLGAYLDSAYGAVPAVDATTGAPITSYNNGYATDPYAAPAAPQPDPFAALPTAAPSSYDAAPVYDAQGGPQFENAVRMVKENRFTEAKAILAAETSRNPSNAAAWRWLADCHYNLLELDDAITCYQRSLDQDHGDYYALRGQGFSYLHRGHEFWRRMQEEVAQNKKEAAAATFARAHEDYKKALEMLGLCLRRAPNDGEAVYGEAMAAEGASRKLYSNAISYLKLGPEQRERAELFAENCLTVINKGIEQSKARSTQVPGDSGPRALLGGLYLRKATLYHQLGKNDLALIDLRNARDAQRSILDEIDKNNATAQRSVQEIETLWDQWGGNS